MRFYLNPQLPIKHSITLKKDISKLKNIQPTIFYCIRLNLFKLQSEHNVCRLSIVSFPPFETGII